MARSIYELFGTETPLIGMVHLKPLPGSAGFAGNLEAVLEDALNDATVLEAAGFDGVIVENMGDRPFPAGRVSLDQAVSMATIVREIVKQVSVPVGVNVQFNAVREEVAIARWCGATFIRVEALTDTVLTPAGLCQPSCGLLVEEFQRWPDRVPLILADVQVKETIMAHPVDFETSCEWVCATGMASALVVSGAGTGKATPLEKVDVAKRVSSLPVIVGSGVNPSTIGDIVRKGCGAIIGSSLKVDGVVGNPVSLERAREVMSKAKEARSTLTGGDGSVCSA